MNAPALFHESLSEALRECIGVLGGTKVVGAMLWPEKTPDAAARVLLDCLNEGRHEKLAPEQLVLILKKSRERGCHAGMTYIARELGYADPIPIEPEDERAKLQRDFVEGLKSMERMAKRLEQLQPYQLVRAS